MKLKIFAIVFWTAGMTALLSQEIDSFKLFLFSLLLTIAVLVMFGVKAFLMSGGDHWQSGEGPDTKE
ncbi:MAG: hypothetical protein RQ867_06670 [Mariprofundaceae bacterium]|nr:hypothetical protein [Mariprofundaceae bacterium]